MRSRDAARIACAALLTAFALAPASAAEGAAEDTDEKLRLGRSVFFNGTLPNGAPLTALIGESDLRVPARLFPCAKCHGETGAGVDEGGVVSADIRWESLTKPYGRAKSDGRIASPYDLKAFAAAITAGVDPDGESLAPEMPRYALGDGEAEALWTLLRDLPDALEVGVTGDAVRIGAALPLSGPRADLGVALARLLQAGVENLNARGPVHGRRLQLAIVDSADAQKSFADLLAELSAEGGVFALVASDLTGREEEALSAARKAGVPLIAPETPERAHLRDADRAFLLTPGAEAQAQLLLEDAQSEFGERPLVVLTDGDEDGLSRARRLVLESAGLRKDAHFLSPGDAGPDAFSAPPAFLVLGRPEAYEKLLGAAPSGSLALAAAATVDPRWLTSRCGGCRVRVSFPSLVGDFPKPVAERFSLAAGAAKLERRHLPRAAAAYSALEILVEGLKRAGRHVARKRFVEQLEKLRDFRGALGPALTFGPNRRIGSTGTHVFEFDPGAQKPNGPSRWVEPRVRG